MLRRWGFSSILVLLLGCGGSVQGGGTDAGLGGGPSGGGGASFGGGGGAVFGGGGSGGAGSCVAPQPGQIDGDYLLTVAMALEPSKPILFLAKVGTEASAGTTGMRWTLHGLLWSDRQTLVGSAISVPAADSPPMAIGADGSFKEKLSPLNVVGEANPLSHTPITFELELDGQLCAAAGFFCGTAAGDVTKPIPIPLTGSTWTLEKVSAGKYPEPPHIDCAMKVAAPVGSFQ